VPGSKRIRSARVSALSPGDGDCGNQHDEDVEYPPGHLLVVTQQASPGGSLCDRNLARQDLPYPVVRNDYVNILGSITRAIPAKIVDGHFVGAGVVVCNGLVPTVNRHSDLSSDQAPIARLSDLQVQGVWCGRGLDHEEC